MAYGEVKVYFDGSHYIGIPHTTNPSRKKYKPPEETVEVEEKEDKVKTIETDNTDTEMDSTLSDLESVPFELEEIELDEINFEESEPLTPVNSPRRSTRKELFNEFYKEAQDMPRSQRKKFLFNQMRPYFNTDKETETYVQVNIERKIRNLICRRIRLQRKAYLQEFNYFCTFTYDSKLHTEDTFKKGLKNTFSNLSKRKGWKYIGVWERSPGKKRLHFHGIFYIPEGTIPGMFIQVEDYNFNTRKRQITNQSIYFNERFGRSDFEEIDNREGKNDALMYLTKYIEKSGEKIVYSKGTPQFFITDILDDDVICPIGMEDKKLLLFDDFTCWDEGTYMGEVSPAVIKQLRTCN